MQKHKFKAFRCLSVEKVSTYQFICYLGHLNVVRIYYYYYNNNEHKIKKKNHTKKETIDLHQ